MIVVSGIQRTGTSLMMSILSEGGLEIIEDDNDERLKDETFKKLQPNYHEHTIYKENLTDENIVELLKLGIKNKCLKIMNDALIRSSSKSFDNIDGIIVMIRDWKCQEKSWMPLQLDNYRSEFAKRPEIMKRINSVSNMDVFVEDAKWPLGVRYGFFYSKLIIDIISRQYSSKICFVDFDDMFIDFNYVRFKIQNQFKINIPKNPISIDKQISKNRKTKIDQPEFQKGFYDFLDFLYGRMQKGFIDEELISKIKYWMPIMDIEFDKKIQKKYGIRLSNL
jgi:hypothetical protein